VVEREYVKRQLRQFEVVKRHSDKSRNDLSAPTSATKFRRSNQNSANVTGSRVAVYPHQLNMPNGLRLPATIALNM
jgi:hypothetical protein